MSFTGVLRLPDFRRVWLAEIISDAGSFITFIALAVYVHDLTDSTLGVGIALALRGVPWIVIGPIGGVIADRMDRRRIMIVADLSRVLLVGLLPFTQVVWQAYALAFVSGVFSPLFRPARQALLPTIAPGEAYVRALALSEVSHQVLHTIGPALGGLAVALVGARRAFFLDAGTFLMSAALVMRVTVRGETRRPRGVGEVLEELRDGARVVRRDSVIGAMVMARSFILFGSEDGTYALLLVYLSQRNLGSLAYGVALGVAGLGSALGTVSLARRSSAAGRTTAILAAGVSPALLIVMLLEPTYSVTLGLLFVLGVAGAGLGLYVSTTIAERIPDSARGRVFSLTGAIYVSGDLSGSLLLTAFGTVIGIPVAMAAGGAVAAVVATAILTRRVSALRSSDDERRLSAETPG